VAEAPEQSASRRSRCGCLFAAVALALVVGAIAVIVSFNSTELTAFDHFVRAADFTPHGIDIEKPEQYEHGERESILWGVFTREDYTFKQPEGAWPFLYIYHVRIASPVAWITTQAMHFNGEEIRISLEAIPLELKPSTLDIEGATVWDTFKDGSVIGQYVELQRDGVGIQLVIEGHTFDKVEDLKRLLEK
jgi:hypothetical protein